MPRYIDVDALKNDYHPCWHDGRGNIYYEVDHAPIVDVEEVKHGYWQQMKAYKSLYVCSRCGDLFPDYKSDYCPNCGAKMDGKDINVPTK